MTARNAAVNRQIMTHESMRKVIVGKKEREESPSFSETHGRSLREQVPLRKHFEDHSHVSRGFRVSCVN